ncbi:Methyltransferase domain-containing protein [Asanoa hainanensis]|uniref:Methyltransferase domain-containing protein n=1 Tax=Asanoa hainanensis TaxID=560556 RepID=A0A239MMK3_9ACTN|nr:methyltransferase domain-containing protein [Asanoa hainanensis]SNT43925.1 Methyltransferase domain-containing protein [Asanoa hainanensis]
MTDIKESVGNMLGLLAGYVGHRTVATGLRTGLVAALANDGPATPDELASRTALDPFYTFAWCRAAYGAGVCDRAGDVYRLADNLATVLLDDTSPAYVGGVFKVLEQPEIFDRFEASLASGERLWWDGCSPEFIAAVGGTGRPFYRRLVPGGLAQVPGLAQLLERGCRVLDTACGSGHGLVMLAEAYPNSEISGVDGDAHSVEVARSVLEAAGLTNITVWDSPLEKLTVDQPYDVVINNISMHECRDIDAVARNVKAALKPGGVFVISDFPFADDDAGLRTAPGRVMSGIQIFEAQIDDQLLPRRVYDDLLARHGFRDLGSAAITPMHALTWGHA